MGFGSVPFVEGFPMGWEWGPALWRHRMGCYLWVTHVCLKGRSITVDVVTVVFVSRMSVKNAYVEGGLGWLFPAYESGLKIAIRKKGGMLDSTLLFEFPTSPERLE